MSTSSNLGLPYLEAAQAQKHVTMNEALQSLDLITQLSVEDMTMSSPPALPVEGERWIVAPGGSAEWAGHDGEIAAWADGAWTFFTARAGWRAWVGSERRWVTHDGTTWVAGPAVSTVTQSTNGAISQFNVMEIDHVVSAGAYNETGLVIPDRAIVFGVSGRVLVDVTGPSFWTLGVAADPLRYASWVDVPLGSTVNGVSGTPTAYYGATPIRITASGSDFVSGQIRLALHYLLLGPPNA